MDQNFFNLLPEELRNISSDLYDVILERASMRVYQNLSEEDKTKMAQIFDSGTEEEKLEFLNTHLSDLPQIITEETKKIIEELKK